MNSQRAIASERDDQAVKSCCANVYQSEWARLLLGDSFHPGGTALTAYLGAALRLWPGQRVLDVAAGQGTSAIHLAQRFGCSVLGIEYSPVAVERAIQAAQTAGVAHLVTFEQGDAEQLPVPAASFDVVVCDGCVRVRVLHVPQQSHGGIGVCARALARGTGRAERSDTQGRDSSGIARTAGMDCLYR